MKFLISLKAIRGGVPVCFPQFGPWEFGPQHGFARDSAKWKVEGEGASVDAATGDACVSQYHFMRVQFRRQCSPLPTYRVTFVV